MHCQSSISSGDKHLIFSGGFGLHDGTGLLLEVKVERGFCVLSIVSTLRAI